MSDTGLRPDIQEWEFGIRELTKVKVYPLSITSQTEFLAKAYQGFINLIKKQEDFSANDEATNKAVIEEIMAFILSNIAELSELVLDEKVNFDKCTNMQLSTLAMIIYEVNYENPAKNAGTLMEKLKNLLFRK
jgi:hypothetical protein